METTSREPKGPLVDRVVGFAEKALAADSVEALVAVTLPLIAEITDSASTFAYISDPRLPNPSYGDHGLSAEATSHVETACAEWLDRLLDGDALNAAGPDGASFTLRPLSAGGHVVGLLGTASSSSGLGEQSFDRLLAVVARAVDRLADCESAQRKLLHLNTYLTVSSMLAKSVDLAELLEIALFCSMEAVAAEAASILLLDEPKENFHFYRVEGPAKPLLGGSSFPVTEGVAGRVLESLEAEIVNDVGVDAQFYGEIDRETGFVTRTMIAVPLVAGEERVGVLEVLNKADGGPFTADERLILSSVADEIAFAIRNATVFDYVVNTYCKRRQGQNSCKGCERPLGSWTPCMRYREFLP
ncbi:GAF domain-containing protein [Candidatus Bipolaricaulota bacterium]